MPSPDLRRPPPARFLVTGAEGQLGSELCRQLGSRATGVDVDQIDLTKPDQVRSRLLEIKPDILVNAAAYTNVDRAEDEPELCYQINARAVETMAEVTESWACRLVQISTDYVFGGGQRTKPIREDERPEAAGIYAQSKLQGEQAARRHPSHLIVRSCGLYGAPGPRSSSNFVATMLRLGRQRSEISVINDQICSPTWIPELAQALLHLIQSGREGVFHVVNPTALSWFQFARMIFQLAQIQCDVNPITTQQYGSKAPRPAYSVLDIAKYAATDGPAMSSVSSALSHYLASRPTD